jgi:hypothetical protein
VVALVRNRLVVLVLVGLELRVLILCQSKVVLKMALRIQLCGLNDLWLLWWAVELSQSLPSWLSDSARSRVLWGPVLLLRIARFNRQARILVEFDILLLPFFRVQPLPSLAELASC